jgi:hypothetical protein
MMNPSSCPRAGYEAVLGLFTRRDISGFPWRCTVTAGNEYCCLPRPHGSLYTEGNVRIKFAICSSLFEAASCSREVEVLKCEEKLL